MVVVMCLFDCCYVMIYENIDGLKNGQVYFKISVDGMDFGDFYYYGMLVIIVVGGWLVVCFMVFWLLLGEDLVYGVLVVLVECVGGGVDEGGCSLWWNMDDGCGLWWWLFVLV